MYRIDSTARNHSLTHSHSQMRPTYTWAISLAPWMARNGYAGGCRLIFSIFPPKNAFPFSPVPFGAENFFDEKKKKNSSRKNDNERHLDLYEVFVRKDARKICLG